MHFVKTAIENISVSTFQEMWKYQVDYWFLQHESLSADYSFLK